MAPDLERRAGVGMHAEVARAIAAEAVRVGGGEVEHHAGAGLVFAAVDAEGGAAARELRAVGESGNQRVVDGAGAATPVERAHAIDFADRAIAAVAVSVGKAAQPEVDANLEAQRLARTQRHA